MLNRLFIVIGVLAILAIAAAFIVPSLISWGQYRDRMEAIASEVLGAPVEVVGDIRFSLLPQPQLSLGEVKVGAADAPVLSVAGVEAQFSLLDFLRDRYLITKLVLDRPSFAATVDADGRIEAGIALAEQATTSNVSVASAEIVDGALSFSDARSGGTFKATNIDGELRMDAVRGPFTFQGTADHDGRPFSARLATSAFDGDGLGQLSAFLQPADQAFSINAEGTLAAGAAPTYAGTLTYRQAPPKAADETAVLDAGRGDMVVTGKFEASAARVLLSDYSITPDENRATTRLTGAAEILLGDTPSFNAVISGGVLALPPRDATADQASLPYELVQLLGEIPLPPVPPIAGTIGVDIAEVDLRAVSLRDVRLDAAAADGKWIIGSMTGRLPGDARVTLSGSFAAADGKPDFGGKLGLATQRLDALGALWRRPGGGNPLLNLAGSLNADVSLVGETLSFSNGTLVLGGGQPVSFEAEIGFAGTDRHLNLTSDLGLLDAERSAALAALLPDAAEAHFGASFPKGRFDLRARSLTMDGLQGTDLAAAGSWEGGVLALDTLKAADLGGLTVDAKLTAFGTLAKPELSGTIDLRVADVRSPALARLYDALGTPPPVRDWLARSLPASLAFRLDAPSGEGGQGIGATGSAGAAVVKLEGKLGEGVARAFGGTVQARLDVTADDPAALTAQLGLGEVSLMPEGSPMHLVAVLDGTAANSFETTVRIDGGGESLAFSGNVVPAGLSRISGNGNLRLTMSDLTALTASIGAGGIWVAPIDGSARVDFVGLDSVKLRDINATSGGQPVTGALEWVQTPDTSAISGSLAIGRVEPAGLLSLLAGPAATISSAAGYWPDGPAATGEIPRRTSGRIDIVSPGIDYAGAPAVTDARFVLAWDGTTIRIRDFAGRLGEGTLSAEVGVCCAGPIAEKQVTARINLAAVDLARLVPKPVSDTVSATLSGSARLDGTGDSLLAAVSAMTGEGSYTLDGLSIRGLSSNAFDAIATLDDVLDKEPRDVADRVIENLEASSFSAPSVSGSFTVAGGVLRAPNLAIPGDTARLFGGVNLRLADLGLSGGFAISPTSPSGPDGMLTEANAKITANLSGTLLAPEASYDVSGMVDTIMVRAYEIEVARLEQIRAEDEKRQREAAAEKARIAAEEAAKKAAEEEAARKKLEEEAAARKAAEDAAAAKAAEEEAARQAAEAEAARKAAEEAAARQAAEAEAARRATEQEALRRAQQQAVEPPPGGILLQPGFNLD